MYAFLSALARSRGEIYHSKPISLRRTNRMRLRRYNDRLVDVDK
jgi:hypothetical protein